MISRSSTVAIRRLNSIKKNIMASNTPQRQFATGACLIIGDEILNGKIHDTNSHFFAKYCFKLGINVGHIAVVSDEEDEIMDAIKRLSAKYDFIVTSGGIGPTHDDITYEAIGKVFGLPVALHEETAERMKRLALYTPKDDSAKKAQLRMATIPSGDNVECIYISDDLWVPVVSINGQVHILPGVPQIFERMLEGLKPYIQSRLTAGGKQSRHFVKTSSKESDVASYLTKLQNEVGKDIKIGSYPHMHILSNTVSIIGPAAKEEKLVEIVKDVEQNVGGKEISAEEEEERSK